jgi:hypothetical protein
MSLAVVLKGAEGVVMAADSRVTLSAAQPALGPPGSVQILPTYFDNASKLLSLREHPYLGVVTYGQGALGQEHPRTAQGYIPEFEKHLRTKGKDKGKKAPAKTKRLTVKAAAQELGAFFLKEWEKAAMPPDAEPMVFLVAGFDEGVPHGKVFKVSVPDKPKPVEESANDFGLTWGGQTFLAERLLKGIAPRVADLAQQNLGLDEAQAAELVTRWQEELDLPIPYGLLPLQDCVDLATFLVEMTADLMTWTIGIQGVGGDIDVATITPSGEFCPVKLKEIHPRI